MEALLATASASLVYGIPVILIWVGYALVHRRRDRRARQLLQQSREAGLMEPASLHPTIDLDRCLGCATCVSACPEANVLGLIDGKAILVNPANCIGHGACREACPVGAISLVLGTERRGIDIPVVDKNFETNVPGIFVAGELGGMGLIRNAVVQGRQAIQAIRETQWSGPGPELDVAIVGAGPAGFAASLAATRAGLRFVTLEQETLGGTVAHYPRGKIVMTAPVELPGYGKVKLRETTKEALLELWKQVESTTGIRINYRERVDGVERQEGGFLVRSSRATYGVRTVLLAIGRRGTPRKLGVPGEESTKVVYRLVEPEQYRGRKVLVVGGGDSALEAASTLADEPGTDVVLAYRGGAFSRAKPANRDRVEAARRSGRLRVLLTSNVSEILRSHVRIQSVNGLEDFENDAVIVCAGGVLPTGFLQTMGVHVETKRGTPLG